MCVFDHPVALEDSGHEGTVGHWDHQLDILTSHDITWVSKPTTPACTDTSIVSITYLHQTEHQAASHEV